MAKKFPLKPAHPERICWGCDKYCAVESMMCGNGNDRAQHPIELFGEGWEEFVPNEPVNKEETTPP
jgi:hypothetical protein